MKRALTYVVLFPPGCLLIFMTLDRFRFADPLVTLLGAAYALMFIPSLAVAAVDRFIKSGWAVVATGALSAALAMLAILRGPNRYGLDGGVFYGAIGAASALVCWLIARMFDHHRRAQ